MKYILFLVYISLASCLPKPEVVCLSSGVDGTDEKNCTAGEPAKNEVTTPDEIPKITEEQKYCSTGFELVDNICVKKEMTYASCGNIAHGENSAPRTMYENSSVIAPAICRKEYQVQTCNDGVLSAYSGSYTYENCNPVDGEVTSNPGVIFGPQSSTKNIEWDFDFVERFDGLKDWGPTLADVGNVGEEEGDKLKMPRLADGSESAWTFYSKWGQSTATDKWIGAFGDNRVWRGTKSASIDLQNEKGPSRLGLYLPKGYKNKFHYFYMVNIAKNQWPTSCEGGKCGGGAVGTYVEGDEYSWYASWKFMTFNYGCGSRTCWENTEHPGYSPVWHQISHIKRFNYTTISSEGLSGIDPGLFIHEEDPGHSSDAWGINENSKENLENLIGDWFGIEYSYTQTADGKTIHDVWIYDQQGNSTKVVDGKVWNTVGFKPDLTWDYFFHGGNNSGTFNWGPTMESVYFIDDVIIDDQRIGPKYFKYIQSEAQLPPDEEVISDRIELGTKWFFLGDSQTAGRAQGTDSSKSHAIAFENIFAGTYTEKIIDTRISGVSGRSLIGHHDSYSSTNNLADYSWVHFQESGNQNQTGQQSVDDYIKTFDLFVRDIVANSPNAIISTETAFSFGRETTSFRNWDAYNTALRLKVSQLRQEGIIVHIADVDEMIKLADEEFGAGNVWYQAGEQNNYHYTGLGNFIVALSIYKSLGYNLATLNLSRIPSNEISNELKLRAVRLVGNGGS